MDPSHNNNKGKIMDNQGEITNGNKENEELQATKKKITNNIKENESDE